MWIEAIDVLLNGNIAFYKLSSAALRGRLSALALDTLVGIQVNRRDFSSVRMSWIDRESHYSLSLTPSLSPVWLQFDLLN